MVRVSTYAQDVREGNHSESQDCRSVTSPPSFLTPADMPYDPTAYATDPSLVVKYSGQVVKMQYEYPPLLREIQDQVEKELGVTFNHCMLNMYEDGTSNSHANKQSND